MEGSQAIKAVTMWLLRRSALVMAMTVFVGVNDVV